MSGDVSTWVAVGGLALAVATFFIGRVSSSRKEGVEAGKLSSDVAHIKQTTDRIEQRFSNDIQQTNGRLDEQTRTTNAANALAVKAMDSAKSAHHRLDEHLRRDHDVTPCRERTETE